MIPSVVVVAAAGPRRARAFVMKDILGRKKK
jgi:hypothetical protein